MTAIHQRPMIVEETDTYTLYKYADGSTFKIPRPSPPYMKFIDGANKYSSQDHPSITKKMIDENTPPNHQDCRCELFDLTDIPEYMRDLVPRNPQPYTHCIFFDMNLLREIGTCIVECCQEEMAIKKCQELGMIPEDLSGISYTTEPISELHGLNLNKFYTAEQVLEMTKNG